MVIDILSHLWQYKPDLLPPRKACEQYHHHQILDYKRKRYREKYIWFNAKQAQNNRNKEKICFTTGTGPSNQQQQNMIERNEEKTKSVRVVYKSVNIRFDMSFQERHIQMLVKNGKVGVSPLIIGSDGGIPPVA